MSNHVTDEERLRRMLLVYECIKNGMSTRACASYLNGIGISISNVTVKDYIDRMMSYDYLKYQEMINVMREHTPKTIDDEAVKTRIKNVLVALNAGYTFKEIAKSLGESEFTVYRDYKKRISMLEKQELIDLGISDEMIKKIDLSLEKKSLDNLEKKRKI